MLAYKGRFHEKKMLFFFILSKLVMEDQNLLHYDTKSRLAWYI